MLTIRPIALKYSTVNFAKPFLVQNFLAFHFRISFIYFGSLKRRLRRFKRKEPTVEDNLLSHTAICPVMWFLSQVLILWFYLKVTISAQHCKRFRTKKLWMILEQFSECWGWRNTSREKNPAKTTQMILHRPFTALRNISCTDLKVLGNQHLESVELLRHTLML